jgi:hypothetical protein
MLHCWSWIGLLMQVNKLPPLLGDPPILLMKQKVTSADWTALWSICSPRRIEQNLKYKFPK